MREHVIEKILERKIIAIIRGMDEDTCLRLADAMYEGGIRLIEVTFNQSDPSGGPAAAAISAITRRFDGKICVGAGTVVTTNQTRIAFDAGAKYIVSPNTDAAVIHKTRELNMVSLPGAMTPTEILAAHHAGANFVKLFPASVLGAGYVKAVRAPISHIHLLAVGGIDAGNVKEYLDAGCVGAGVGGKLVNKEWIRDNKFDKITEAAAELCAAAGANGG